VATTLARSAGSFVSSATDGGKIVANLSSTRQLSTMIFKDFVYPFELTSFLILIAILGAIVLAQRES
jgi:NADH:ubiquinone oxidoreductase subunit 6 (subunit J)